MMVDAVDPSHCAVTHRYLLLTVLHLQLQMPEHIVNVNAHQTGRKDLDP
jgi:hypothetical protein